MFSENHFREKEVKHCLQIRVKKDNNVPGWIWGGGSISMKWLFENGSC